MSRVSQCIKMLEYLNSYEILNRNQLAEYLETNPRNIREYRKELEESGIHIHEKRGRNGGYFLNPSFRLPVFSRREQECLKSLLEISTLNFEQEHLIRKLTVETESIYQYGDQLHHWIEIINHAIQNRLVVRMVYKGINQSRSYRLDFWPQQLFLIKNHWMTAGWAEQLNQFLLVELSPDHISGLKKTERAFTDQSFVLEQFVQNHSRLNHLILFIVRISKNEWKAIKQLQWSLIFKQIDEEKDCYLFSFYQEAEFIEVLLKHKIEILAPKEIRESIKSTLYDLSQLYNVIN